VNFDKLTYAGLRESIAELQNEPRHALVEGDVADAALVREVLADRRPHAVLHLAAETHVDRSIDAPPDFARTNVLGTCTLLDEVTRFWQDLASGEREAFRFLLASTDEVFGSVEAGKEFTEHSPLLPNSPYAASKAAAEHLGRAFFHTYGLPVVTINPTNNYGPRQLPEKLIAKMILAAANGEPLPLYGDGLHERDWLHVEDCCEAIRAVVHRGVAGRRYLAGAGNGMPNIRVLEKICDLVDEHFADGGNRRGLIQHVADRPGHDRRYSADSTPLRQELGWRPRVTFDQGLRDTVAWYLSHADWNAAAFKSLQARDAAARPAAAPLPGLR
jgi:dTDP-glucose 4,6-dehydratase